MIAIYVDELSKLKSSNDILRSQQYKVRYLFIINIIIIIIIIIMQFILSKLYSISLCSFLGDIKQ